MFSRRDFLRISAMASAAALVNWQFPEFIRAEGAGEGEYDVIVIGAGLGGLSSAALLAMNGLRPLVIDKRDVAGGYASSFQRGNFTCEVALHGITGNPLSQVLLQQLGVLDKLALIPHTYSWNSIYPDFPVNLPQPPLDILQEMLPFIQGIFQKPEMRPYVLSLLLPQLNAYLNSIFTEPEGSIYSVLATNFPAEEEGLARYMACWRDLLADIMKFYLADQEIPDDPAQFQLDYPIWASLLWKKKKIKAQSLDDLFREYKINSPELKAILGQSWPYYGLPSSEIPAWFYLMTTGMYHAFGNFYLLGNPENNPDSVDMFGSSQDLSNLLMKSITKPPTPAGAPFPFPGGEVFLSTEVTEIILHPETGRAVGVKTNSGAEYYAKAVISNASVPQTFELLLSSSEVPKDYLKTVSKYEPSTSHFNVWLGVELPEDQDDPFRKAYDKLASNTAVYPGYDHDRMFRGSQHCNPEETAVAIIAYDKLFSDNATLQKMRSPDGCASITLTMLCGYEPWKKFEEVYRNQYADEGDDTVVEGTVTFADYRAEKERIAELLISIAETVLPGLSKRIVMREASTPLTNVRFTYNTDGAIYGYEQALDNSGLSRLGNRTPVPGLYLAGAWTNPGGSFELVMLSGKEAVKCMVEDWERAKAEAEIPS